MGVKFSNESFRMKLHGKFIPEITAYMYSYGGSVHTKVVQRIVKFQILDFCQIFFMHFWLSPTLYLENGYQ